MNPTETLLVSYAASPAESVGRQIAEPAPAWRSEYQRDRDRVNDVAYQFGLFIDQQVAGEVNLNNVVRGAMQSGTIGYWIDRHHAGQAYIAEGVGLVMQFAFEQLGLHRVEICIVPRNTNSTACVWEFMKPGITALPVASRVSISGYWRRRSSLVPTATIP